MGAMIKDPVVPLSPSLLPQQRLYEVKALMTWPSGVKPIVGYPGELGVPNLPKRRSRNAIYLCQAEWAWTPHHNRLAAYYLARGSPALAALARRSQRRDHPVVMGVGNRRLGVARGGRGANRRPRASLPPTGHSSATGMISIAITA